MSWGLRDRASSSETGIARLAASNPATQIDRQCGVTRDITFLPLSREQQARKYSQGAILTRRSSASGARPARPRPALWLRGEMLVNCDPATIAAVENDRLSLAEGLVALLCADLRANQMGQDRGIAEKLQRWSVLVQDRTRKPRSRRQAAHSCSYAARLSRRCGVVWKMNVAPGSKSLKYASGSSRPNAAMIALAAATTSTAGSAPAPSGVAPED